MNKGPGEKKPGLSRDEEEEEREMGGRQRRGTTGLAGHHFKGFSFENSLIQK